MCARGASGHRRWALRAWLVGATVAMVAALVAWWVPQVDADTRLGTTGQFGPSSLFDEPGKPGASCVYVPSTTVITATVTAPYVLGLDREKDVTESTAVAWRATLRSNGDLVGQSVREDSAATENSSAQFRPITLSSPPRPGRLTVQVEIQWIDPGVAGETVVGSSLHEVDYYSLDRGDGSPVQEVEDGCLVVAAEPPTATNTPVPTATPPPTATHTATASATATSTATVRPTSTATASPIATATATGTATPTGTRAPTATAAATATATGTAAATATATATISAPPTATRTSTPDPLVPSTPSAPATATQTATPDPITTSPPTPTMVIPPTATTEVASPPDPSPSGPPTLAMSASRGIVNSTLRLTLSGFPASQEVEIAFSGAVVATMPTTPSGTLAIAIKVPAKPIGTYPVWAASGAVSASGLYTIAPRIKVIPGTVSPGEQVEISLRGFGRNEAVRIRWLVDGRWVDVGWVARTSNTGSANILITVPANADVGPTSVRGDGSIARAQTNAVLVE